MIRAMIRASDLTDRAFAINEAPAPRSLLRDADVLFDRFLEGDGDERGVVEAYETVGRVAISILMSGNVSDA